MKKALIVLLGLVLTLGVSAQKRGGYHHSRPATRVIIRGGYSPYYYSPFYSPWSYSPYNYGYTYYHRTSKLDFEMADIKSDYKERIRDVRHDKSISGKERRKQVHELRVERDKAIRDATKNYYLRRK